MSATVILMIVIVILLLTSRVIGLNTGKHPPGPFSWPFIGNKFLLNRLTRKLGAQHLAFLELSKRYSSNVITLQIGISKIIIVSGNKFIRSMLHNEDFDGRPWNEFIKMRNLGKKQGVTMNDGSDWKELRTWIMQALKIFGFGKYRMSEMIKEELTVILEKLKEGGVRRLKPVIAPAVINVLWTITTGKRFTEGPRLQYFMDLLDRRSRVFDMVGGLLTTFPWIRYIAPEASGYNLLLTLNNELKDFLLEIIAEHKQNYVVGGEVDLIDMFIEKMNKEDPSNLLYNEDQLVMILIDIFLAGLSITTNTLDLIFMNTVVHQDIQQKVQKEIDSVISTDRIPDLTDKPNMPYVEAVITESLRRWPVFPLVGPRRVLHDTKLDEYTIPKDSTVLMNIYTVNMDPEVYPDPNTFRPERHIKEDGFNPDVDILTFGKGKRRCPGNVLAKSALFLLFVGVLQKYSLLPVPGKGPTTTETVPGLVMAPKYYEVLVVPR
ncbi:putative cytochrome P450 305a1 isoform X1 [Ptiloglossa arizonensis]|uniref:putative cytochrome P450 305a1 isoform X1 n=1 Tax=Ptiloglossa arizonensis TaxID=3350558 RepID=UPI003F9EEC6C